jgi:hypothetical protein
MFVCKKWSSNTHVSKPRAIMGTTTDFAAFADGSAFGVNGTDGRRRHDGSWFGNMRV